MTYGTSGSAVLERTQMNKQIKETRENSDAVVTADFICVSGIFRGELHRARKKEKCL